MKTCSNCGQANPDEAVFCGKCGSKLTQEEVNVRAAIPRANRASTHSESVALGKDEFKNDGKCPYCDSNKIKRKLLEGPYSEKEANAFGYWYKWDCKCKQCGKEWFGMDYYHYEDPDMHPIKRFKPPKRLVITKRESNLVVIQTVQGEMTAQVIKVHLESEGIPVILKSENLGIAYGMTLDGLGEVNILVPKEFAEEAKQILKRDTS